MEVLHGEIIDIVELKKQIEDNTFSKDLLICVCKDDSAKFIATQYLHYYARKNSSEIKLIEDPEIQVGNNFFDDMNLKEIYVYKCEKLEIIPRVVGSKLWIICDKISKNLKNEYKSNVVEFQKLEDWQIKDYVVTTSHITDEQASVLMSTYKDIVKLDIEIQKLTIFRQNMFDELKDQLVYIEEKSIFDLVNALIQRDRVKLSEACEKGIDDIEPFALLSLLTKNLKAIISIQLAKNPTAESLGMSGKQFWAVSKFSCNHYSREELLYLFDFITQIDSKIKSGEVDTSNVVNHIISKFLGFM